MTEQAPKRTMSNEELAERILDMLERVEWVRGSGGRATVCPFCHAVSERDGGPGHIDDCEWLLVTREGNEMRLERMRADGGTP